jgi:hypothetical protein
LTLPSKNPFLFGSNGKNHIDEETVNSRLRDLARESNIEIGNSKLTWHCFRDMVISQGKNLSIDPDVLKLMVGKSISKAMLPYLTGIDVKTAFMKLQKITGISIIIKESEGNIKKIESLENAMMELEKENKTLRTRIEVLQSKLEETDNTMKRMSTDFEDFKTVVQKKLGLKETVKFD